MKRPYWIVDVGKDLCVSCGKNVTGYVDAVILCADCWMDPLLGVER